MKTVDEVKAIVEEAMENDNPELIKEILEEKVSEDDYEYDSAQEFISDDYFFEDKDDGVLTWMIRTTLDGNKVNMFKFLKEIFPDSWSWEREVQIIRVEHHQVQYFDKGEAIIDAKEFYKIDNGNIVLDKEKIQDIGYDVDFDNIGKYCWTAQNGSYDVDYYDAKDEEIKNIMAKADVGVE